MGRSNNPLYIQTVGQEDELKFHFIVHTSLDVVDARFDIFFFSFVFFFFLKKTKHFGMFSGSAVPH